MGEAQWNYATAWPGTLRLGGWKHFGRFADQRVAADGRDRLATVMQQTGQFAQEPRQYGALMGRDHRRDERLAESYREVISPLGDMTDAQRHPAFGDLAIRQQAQARLRKLDRCRLTSHRVLIRRVLVNDAVPCQ